MLSLSRMILRPRGFAAASGPTEAAPIFPTSLTARSLLTGLLLLATIWVNGCGKPPPPKMDPHSPEAVLLELAGQGKLLNEALGRQDYTYLHDFGFRFKSLCQAFLGKLEAEQRQQMRAKVLELLDVAGQLDKAAGGHRAEATAASVQKIVHALQETERLYQETKKSK